MLGSFSSSAMRSSRYLELYTSERQVEAAGDLGIGLLHLLLRRALRLADGGDDQVLEQRHVLLLEHLGRELELLQHLLAVDDRLHEPAARGGLVALLGELFLKFAHLLLHLLRRLHHVAEALHHVLRSPPRPARSMTSPSNTSMARSIIGLRLSACAARCAGVTGSPAVQRNSMGRPNARASSSCTIGRCSLESITERCRSSIASTSASPATPTSWISSRNAPSMRLRSLTRAIVCRHALATPSSSVVPSTTAVVALAAGAVNEADRVAVGALRGADSGSLARGGVKLDGTAAGVTRAGGVVGAAIRAGADTPAGAANPCVRVPAVAGGRGVAPPGAAEPPPARRFSSASRRAISAAT